MRTLLLAKHDNKRRWDAAQTALTAAWELGGEIGVLVAGKDCRSVAEAAAKLAGVAKVLLAEDGGREHRLAEPTAALIVSLAGPYDAIVAPATTTGKNVMPRVAALLDVMQISDVIKVLAPHAFERPIYAGNAIQTLRSRNAKKLLTIRTSTFQPTGTGGSAPIETVAVPAGPAISSFLGEKLSKSDRQELTGAESGSSGGRAMPSRENFTK